VSSAVGIRSIPSSIRLVLLVCFASILTMGVAATAVHASEHGGADEVEVKTISISGTTTANGEKVPPGAAIVVFKIEEDGSESQCGRFTTESGGRFTLSLNVVCTTPGTSELNYRIEGMSAEATTVSEVADGISNLDIGFAGLSDEELLRLGLVTAGTVDLQQKPLISEESLKTILIITIHI
jgi:hypothetical protein